MISGVRSLIDDTWKKEQEVRDAWRLGSYTGGPCQNCGRVRVCKCPNNKHRCEKCGWCPEKQIFITIN